MRYDFIAELAKEKAGLAADFHNYEWESLHPDTDGIDALRMEFAKCPLLVRGKFKGRPNFRKATEYKTVWLTGDEITQRAAEWEKRTGKCSECEGTTQVFHSWNHETVTKFRPCDKCNATGKSA